MTATTAHPAQSSSIRVLIVEDEIVIARDIEGCLINLGYVVADIVASGDAAITKAAELQPNLVLMDIRLTGEMDGIQAAEQIWGRLSIPIVYITGFSDKNTLERAKITCPFGYILKPAAEQELYVAIETALQQYQVNRELQQREQWLATVLRDIGDGVIVVDADGNIRFLNLIATALTGWSQAEATGKPIVDVFHIVNERTQERVENPAIAVLRDHKLLYLPDHTLLLSKAGIITPIADSAAPLRDATGNVVGAVLVFRDVTQRRLAEERDSALKRAKQLELQMQELQRLDQLKDDFLSTVSHELRTPLANMKMAIQMLEIVLNQQNLLLGTSDTNRTVRYLEILRNQCNQELSLVNDLLNLQQLNANAYSLVPTTIQLHQWLPKIAAGFQERIQSNQQQLILDVPPQLPPLVSDEASLSRILTELLNNGCKYTPAHEKITVTVKLIEMDYCQISVTNTGVEIPAADLPHIFDQFYRIPASDIRNQGGTGLGLTLVKQLVNHLNGQIQVTSTSSQTCFMIRLPLRFPQRSSITIY